jgi:hypothetical protein
LADARAKRLSGQVFESYADFRARIRSKNSDEIVHDTTVEWQPSTTATGKPLEKLSPEDEGNVPNDSKQQKILDQIKREIGVVEAARLILERASPEDRAQVAGMALADPSTAPNAKTLEALSWPPFPRLPPKKVAAIIQQGKKRSWNERREFGYEWRTNVFEFVKKEYTTWIPGLTQAHIKDADIHLYRIFTRCVSEGGLPEWLDVPSEVDAELRQISDPVDRLLRLLVREFERSRMQASRAAPK